MSLTGYLLFGRQIGKTKTSWVLFGEGIGTEDQKGVYFCYYCQNVIWSLDHEVSQTPFISNITSKVSKVWTFALIEEIHPLEFEPRIERVWTEGPMINCPHVSRRRLVRLVTYLHKMAHLVATFHWINFVHMFLEEL